VGREKARRKMGGDRPYLEPVRHQADWMQSLSFNYAEKRPFRAEVPK